MKEAVATILEVVSSNQTQASGSPRSSKRSQKLQLPALLSKCIPSDLPSSQRLKILPFILPHLVHAHFELHLARPLCSGLSSSQSEALLKIAQTVKSSGGSGEWIKITHQALRKKQTLFDRNSFTRSKLNELQNLLSEVLVWNGSFSRTKDCLSLMNSVYESLREAFNLLDRIVVMMREDFVNEGSDYTLQEKEGEYQLKLNLASDLENGNDLAVRKNSSASDLQSGGKSQPLVTISVGLVYSSSNFERLLIRPQTCKFSSDGEVEVSRSSEESR